MSYCTIDPYLEKVTRKQSKKLNSASFFLLFLKSKFSKDFFFPLILAFQSLKTQITHNKIEMMGQL